MLDINSLTSVVLTQQPFMGERALNIRFSSHEPSPQYSGFDAMVSRLVDKVNEKGTTTIQLTGNWYEQDAAADWLLALDATLREQPYVDYDNIVYMLQVDNYVPDHWLDEVAVLRSALIFVTMAETLSLGVVNTDALSFVDHLAVHPESVYLRYPVSRTAPYSKVDTSVFELVPPEQVYFTPMAVRHHGTLQRAETARNVAFAIELVQCHRAQLNLPAMEYLE